MERWLDIPGYPGYQVSDAGNVRSIDRVIYGGRWGVERRKGKLLKPGADTDGYLHVSLSVGQNTFIRKVHRLVLLAFVGESELIVNHKDSNRKNNFLSNLEYVTHKQNVNHSIEAGLSKRKGAGNPNARLTDDDVIMMRKLKAGGIKTSELGKMYGMNTGNINRIISGRQWKHLT